MSTYTQFNRRTFLTASGSTLALPFLETFAGETPDSAKDFKRMIFIGVGYGFTEKTFYPTKSGRFSEIGLTPGLKNLEKHKDNFSLIGNLTNLGASNPHGGSTSYLTCANTKGTPGKMFHNSISCDLLAASQLGQDTRYSNLTLSNTQQTIGHRSRSMSWDANGKPVSGLETPLALYSRLFANSKESLPQLLDRIKEKTSVLDIMKISSHDMAKHVSRDDKDKLEEYFQSIRQIELDLEKQVTWSKIDKPKAPFKTPGEMDGEAEIKLIFQMMALALQTDQTRVISYMLPNQSLLSSMNLNIGAHSVSHYGFAQDRIAASKLRDAKLMELFGYLIDLFKSTKDVYGNSIYDNSIISFGTNLRSVHTLKGLPLMLSGGGANLKLGESIIMPEEDTPLANVWLTLMQQAGVKIDRFSHSTGIAEQILA